ncbi:MULTISPECIES: magnesium transporter CorA family protein [unclassified Clostridium]|uniref:magnesium transporter CorA family protein n=1 Tax=unclassified Clostridium TaxID=2614128 RepID=UPI000297E01B|nr:MULTISPECIES: magnesium transporter CorA family protein [unclassified Clostridium]EKQ58320.1 MAG: Mg/Co transporter [Clostridium sp. Maddingley MBC34-26]
MFTLPFKTDKKHPVVLKKLETEVRIIEFNGLKWIDIIRPTNKEIEMLEDMYEFHELLLEDCITEHQRSKIDSYDDYSFIVLHLPRYKKDLARLDSEEIDIFISHNYLVTLHEGELKPLVEMAQKCENNEDIRKEYMSEGSALLLYEIIKALFDYCFPMLDKIGNMVNEINRAVFATRSKEMLETISRTKMQIINYRSVIKPLRPVIINLEKVIKNYLPEDMDMYFDDITDKIEKIWDMLENYKEVIESADNTFASLTNHTMNGLMRTFTIIQVAILPMTLVSGLFSMNVQGIPMHDYEFAFWIVFGMIFIPTIFIGVVLLLKKDKWF